MTTEPKETFSGFPDFRANVTFVPIQFFTVVVPHCSRGTVRIVGYALRKVLGWVDEQGNPTREQLRFTYRELIEHAGVSRDSIAEAIREATEKQFLRCIKSPHPDRLGESAQSGVYEILWDNEGRYTDNPADFKGFYFPEAAVIDELDGSRLVARPKAARKNIPNTFFDYLLPRERLSVIRTVGALLFYSIQWGPGGERKVPVTKSITELSRLTKLSRQHTHEAVMEACERGYIEQTDAGCFDPAAGTNSRSATYAIHWTSSGQIVQTSPVGKSEREIAPKRQRSEKVHGLPVRKSERNQSNKVNGERSEMVNDIRIKKELKTLNTTTGANDNGGLVQLAVVVSGFDLLRKAGFDERTARRLADKHSTEIIEKQIHWLDRRTTSRNRLGLLRRAIEKNWPQPESFESAASPLARLFASHYYAAYHDYSGEAATEPFAKDLEVAAKFIPRLLAQEPAETMIPQWGQKFGRLMRQNHQGDSKAKPNLSFALVLFGDKFLRLLQSEGAATRRKALGAAREAHQRQFMPDYMAYLHQTENGLQRTNPSIYGDFEKHRERLRKLMTSGPFLASAERLSHFEKAESRLLDFAAFFQDHPKKLVLNFWEWDASLNSSAFKPAKDLPVINQEVQP